jgi:hypothetical protein
MNESPRTYTEAELRQRLESRKVQLAESLEGRFRDDGLFGPAVWSLDGMEVVESPNGGYMLSEESRSRLWRTIADEVGTVVIETTSAVMGVLFDEPAAAEVSR